MPRIRTIKPEFFKHEMLFEAEEETGLPLRLSFIGLWTCCDKEGRFKWRPRSLKLDILPYDDVDFSRVLDALTTRGFVVKYRVDNACYGSIPSFRKHQIINNRESSSDLPAPSNGEIVKVETIQEDIDASATRQPRVKHASSTRLKGKGKEGKGKEGEKNTESAQNSEESTEDDLPADAGDDFDEVEFIRHNGADLLKQLGANEKQAYSVMGKALNDYWPEQVETAIGKLSTFASETKVINPVGCLTDILKRNNQAKRGQVVL